MIDFQKMRKLINRLPEERFNVTRARARAEKITTTITGMPRGSSTGKQVEDGAILIMLAEEKLEATKYELKEMRNELKPIIKELEKDTEREVIILRYLKGWNARKIAFSMGYSEPWVFKELRAAEKNINAIHEEMLRRKNV